MKTIDHRARAEDVHWLAETGEGATRAAERLGITYDALEKWCRLHGHSADWNRMRARDPFVAANRAEVSRRNAEVRWAS